MKLSTVSDNGVVNSTSEGLAADTPPIFLMGATAAGKTALSLSIAKQIDAEIISVDSALVYRGMDIGTAKPSSQERALVPHHLIDVVDPWQAYSAAQFCSDAARLIQDIHARGKRALLVGGTMLYYKALEEGLAKLPEADSKIREALTQQAQSEGWQALHDELRRIDPAAAQRIHPNDPQRLQRALEVYRITGKTLSELQTDTQSQLLCKPVKFALVPKDRAWLHRRIKQRFIGMLEDDFMSEMQSLYRHPRLHAELPAMRSVGYRQAWDYLDSQKRLSGTGVSDDENQWIEKAIVATRQLAKRQLTWIRSMSDISTIECDTLSQQQQFECITQAIQQDCSTEPFNRF